MHDGIGHMTPPKELTPQSRHPPRADPQEQTSPPGADTPLEQTPPEQTPSLGADTPLGADPLSGRCAGGMHPTGMHSFWIVNLDCGLKLSIHTLVMLQK